MKTRNIAVYLLALLIVSCSAPSEKGDGQPKDSVATDSVKTVKETPKDTLVYDKKFDNISSFISGMLPDSAAMFSQFDTTTNWKSFAANFDSVWKTIDTKRISKMKEWKAEELADVYPTAKSVFYPFSGPDFLNANIFFSEADTFRLIGLEPVGALPEISKMKPKDVNEYLTSVNNSLSDLFRRSYFITKNMLNDLSRNKVNGTVPLMCVFLKRSGHTITNIKLIGVDSSGNIVPRVDTADFKGSKGVQISFMSPGNRKIKTLYYFKTDLSDGGMKSNKGFTTYLEKMDTVVTYLKAASHLLHYGSFTYIRNIILDKSTAVLQDDSGIAYKFFQKDKWDVKLYGNYSKAVKDFKGVDQQDLKQAYKSDTTVQTLPFDLGYHWGSDEVNLQLATRKK